MARTYVQIGAETYSAALDLGLLILLQAGVRFVSFDLR